MASPDVPMEAPPQEVRVVAPEQYDMTQKVTTSPLYSLYDVFPQDGAQTGNLEPTAVHIKEFLIPAKRLLNLSRSILTYNLQIQKPNATGGGKAVGVYLSNVSPFAQIRLFTRTGTHLVNITNGHDYHKLCVVTSLDPQRYKSRQAFGGLGNDAADFATAEGNNQNTNQVHLVQKPDQTDWAKIVSPANPLKNDGTEYKNIIFHDDLPAYALLDNGAANYVQIPVSIQLGDLIGTVFAMDKSIMFSDTLVLQITFSGHRDYIFAVDSVAAPEANRQAATAVSYTDMRLRLCQDLNLNARQTWLGRIQSEQGFVATIPYVTMFERNIGTGNTAASTIRINRGHGSSLLRVISGIRRITTDATTDGKAPYDYYNYKGNLTLLYQTLFNDQPLQPKLLDTKKSEDWYYNHEFFQDGGLSQELAWRSWVGAHVDQFGSDAARLVDAAVSDFHKSGYPLDTEVTFTRNESSKDTSATNHLFCVVCQKTMRINALGISVL